MRNETENNKETTGNGTGTAVQRVSVKKFNRQRVDFQIVGVAPYVQHKFSAKAKNKIKETQEAGATARGKKQREAKDFERVYQEAIHYSADGWIGIPASAFRNAMISACRTIGYKMTHAKLAVFVDADGFDRDDGTPLVRIHGEPECNISPARNDNGSIDLRARPMWREGWIAKVRLSFDADMFTVEDVANLLQRAGLQVGIGEGRPDSKNSPGCGWGTFDIRTPAKA